MIENRVVGIKSREVYEAPAAIALIEAHRALEDLVLTKDELRLKRTLEVAWTELVYEGLWFSPAREAIDAFVDQTQGVVGGEVRLSLRPGTAVVTGRRSDQALYAETLASYAPGETFPHEAAEGFVRLASLETRARRGSQAGDGRDDMTLWSGRVREGMAPEVWSYLLADDAELLPYDLEGTRLHARRLRAAGLLDDAELEEAERILATISPADRLPDDEDVHSMIERLLGDVGRKIHAGRSRNDQVAAASAALRRRCVPRGRRRAARAGTRRARARRGRGRDADARLHAPAACAAGHGRPPPAGVGGDARARPGTVLRRGRPGRGVAAGIGGAGRLHARAASTRPAAAQLARRRVGP